MRTILIFGALLLAAATASPAMAQEGISGDAAVTYRWVHTNAAPGDCGCFGVNGAGVSASWNVRGPWSVVADFGSGVAKGAPTAGSSLTLTSGMGGARFELPVLRGAGLLKRIERADASQGFHFLGQRLDAVNEIGKAREFATLALAQDGFLGAISESFDEQDWDANCPFLPCSSRRKETAEF